MLALGEGVTLQTQRYAFTLADGAQLESLCLTASGSIRFGRYGQQVRTALINLDTGEEMPLNALIADMAALEERLTACVEGYQEQLKHLSGCKRLVARAAGQRVLYAPRAADSLSGGAL